LVSQLQPGQRLFAEFTGRALPSSWQKWVFEGKDAPPAVRVIYGRTKENQNLPPFYYDFAQQPLDYFASTVNLPPWVLKAVRGAKLPHPYVTLLKHLSGKN
jgi:hypothetical protein